MGRPSKGERTLIRRGADLGNMTASAAVEDAARRGYQHMTTWLGDVLALHHGLFDLVDGPPARGLFAEGVEDAIKRSQMRFPMTIRLRDRLVEEIDNRRAEVSPANPMRRFPYIARVLEVIIALPEEQRLPSAATFQLPREDREDVFKAVRISPTDLRRAVEGDVTVNGMQQVLQPAS